MTGSKVETIDLKNKPDTSIEHKSGHTEIYISKANKSNSNSKNDKNKNENKNKILIKQNTTTSLRTNVTSNIAQKYNIRTTLGCIMGSRHNTFQRNISIFK